MTSTTRAARPAKSVRWALTAAVAGPYVVSLAMPAVTGPFDAPDTTAPGIQALLMGWIVSPISWAANVLLPVGLLQFLAGRTARATIVGAAALASAGLPLVLPQGLQLNAGYYLWLSSMGVFLIGSLLVRLRQGPVRRPDPTGGPVDEKHRP